MKQKSSLEDIRHKFDTHVDAYSNEVRGQTSIMDSPLALQLVSDTVALTNPDARHICDIGCGGGNFTLRILQNLPHLSCTLVDLSAKMLQRAQERIIAKGAVVDQTIQGAVQSVEIPTSKFDIIVAAAVLHHLRSREEWSAVLQKIYRALATNGTFWYWDLIKHENDEVDAIQWKRYKQYLIDFKDETYQQQVFQDIEQEDSPETPTFILTELLKTGFRKVDIVHKNAFFVVLMGKK